jgi:putative transposase
MSEKYKFLNPEGIYFTTLTITNWIDLFTRSEYCIIVLDALRYCQAKKGLMIYASCIMPSHVHLIIGRNGTEEISGIIRDFKRFTNEKIISEIKQINESRREWLLDQFSKAADRIKRVTNYKVWQDGNHPIELSTNEMMDQRLDYLHENPVKAGIVWEPHHYAWSSAIDYSGGSGLLKIKFLG